MSKLGPDYSYIYRKINKLTMIGFTGTVRKKNKSRCVYVLCECGTLKELEFSYFKRGCAKSCGCLQKQEAVRFKETLKINGIYATDYREYSIWMQMRNRTTTSKSEKSIRNYQDRNIRVCEEWDKSSGFRAFITDMGRCPEGYELDRIDVTGDYCKENCRWISRSVNQFNKNLSDRNSTGAIGVGKGNAKFKYRAYISKEGMRQDLGYYTTFNAALEARILAEIKLYGFVTKEKLDKYPDIVENCQAMLNSEFPDVVVHYTEENSG